MTEGKLCFYAIDEAGNDETPINEEEYEIDTDAPESHALALPTYSTDWNFDVNYTTSLDSDLDYVELYYSFNNGAYQQYSDIIHADGHFFLSPVEFQATSDGNYKFYTRATDDVGNTEDIPGTLPDTGAEIIVDTVSPIDPTVNLTSLDFVCNLTHTPQCHTEEYDVEIIFDANSDFDEIYILGDVTTDAGSTYF